MPARGETPPTPRSRASSAQGHASRRATSRRCCTCSPPPTPRCRRPSPRARRTQRASSTWGCRLPARLRARRLRGAGARRGLPRRLRCPSPPRSFPPRRSTPWRPSAWSRSCASGSRRTARRACSTRWRCRCCRCSPRWSVLAWGRHRRARGAVRRARRRNRRDGREDPRRVPARTSTSTPPAAEPRALRRAGAPPPTASSAPSAASTPPTPRCSATSRPTTRSWPRCSSTASAPRSSPPTSTRCPRSWRTTAHPHHPQPDGDRDGTPLELRPQPAEHPHALELGHRVRQAFTVPEGSVFLACDYSQIELRLLAHLR